MLGTAKVLEIVEAYLALLPTEREKLRPFLEQVQAGERLNNRKVFPGHITGAALVLSPQRDKILMIHHQFLGKWLQPGGHWDPDESDPWTAARREAEEETNVHIAEQIAPFDDPRIPLDIDIHKIPARPERDEPEHYHYDFRYVFVAASEELQLLEKEVSAAEWMAFEDPRLERIRGTIGKLRKFNLVA